MPSDVQAAGFAPADEPPNDFDVVGFPLCEAEEFFRLRHAEYAVEMTRPTKKFFPVDENQIYVVRQRRLKNGVWQLTAAAGPRREVS